jgi:hypothetical protein
MYFVATIAIAIVVIVLAAVFYVLAHLRARRTSTADLERFVFDDRIEYFKFIGESSDAVSRFRQLIKVRDGRQLYTEWPSIERTLRKAELAAGHRGRPLIMDYFLDYRVYVRELLRRGNSGAASG